MEFYHVNQRDEIRRHYSQKGPCQPRNHAFERREIGGRVRKFNPSWFDDYKYWLEYSIELEATFCLCCYLFKSEIKNQGGADNFVKGGFKAWNKRERLDLHNNGGPHNLAVQKCQNLMNQAQSIANVFYKQTDLTKDKNRIKIHVSIDCVRFLLRQGLLFRGHNESDDSKNKDHELSYSKVRGQGYDGASNMRGTFNGLKTLIMNDVPFAYYIHCFAHQLQLALVFVAKNHHDINDFFELISRLLNMTGSSYKRRDKLRDKQATRVMAALANGEIESSTGMNQESGIKRPSDTRWGSHYGSLLNIKTLYPSICKVLEDVMEDANCQDHRSEARRMLKSIMIFDFVFCLHLMVDILGITNELNKTLQRKDQDIINAMHQVRAQKKDYKKRGMKDGNHF